MERILPAYPLWVIDPNFSIWSRNELLADVETTFWTGDPHSAYGFVYYNGKNYCFMGASNEGVRLRQTALSVSAFSTDYEFECDEFTLKCRFISPLLPNDPELLSCPVCYTDYEIIPKGKLAEDFSISIVLSQDMTYREKARVVGAVLPFGGFEAAYMTRERNLYLSSVEDCAAPDYGDVFITGEEAFVLSETFIKKFYQRGKVEFGIYPNEPHFALAINRKEKGSFMVAYDDKASIFYFGEWLKAYYFKGGKTVSDALVFSYENHDSIVSACDEFDKKLKRDSALVGEGYYDLAVAALRQSVGAHKLVEDSKGKLLFLSKENNSDGCIGTVDVSYPSMPLFLLYNPELVVGMMNGIFDFARMPVWEYDFAPHDLGFYPWCSGQVYSLDRNISKYRGSACCIFQHVTTAQNLYIYPAGTGIYTDESQMPVEECGNMLIMAAAAIVAGADKKFAKENFDLFSSWVKYLEKFGLRPEHQLCTDDFAGHLKNNVNLAIKALVGIESYSVIARALGKNKLADKYFEKAKVFRDKFLAIVGDGVMPLSYDLRDSFSLKYNILFDKLFGFDLIGSEICERETDHYIKMANSCGTPLDTREDYTKSDWILWCSALTDDAEKCRKIYAPVLNYLKETPSRVPFGDWYYSKSGRTVFFMARSVQGGIFAPLLKASGKMKIE